jgi:pimeloyl-ACP methyl ester carboxylesterase
MAESGVMDVEDGFIHRFVERAGVRLHVVEAGPPDGRLVILLHGFPELWWTWRRQVRALADAGFRVLAPDQRGYNTSDKPPGLAPYRLDELVADVEHLVVEAGHTSAAVVGHDWGGLVAWELAMRRPARVERLGIVNMPHPQVIRERVWRPPHVWMLAYLWFFQLPFVPEALLPLHRHYLLRMELAGSLGPAELDRHLEAYGQPGAIPAQIRWYRAAFREYLRGGVARVIEVPVRIVWGVRDRHIHPSLATPPEALVPRAEVVWLPEASHWVQADAPDELNVQLLELLS